MAKRKLGAALAATIALKAVGAELAELGACYDVSTNRATCAFNASWCPGDQAWKTPTELDTLAGVDGCACATTDVGSCYDYVSTHISTCHPHPAQCPADHSWVDPGYVFSDGSECLCTTDRLNGATAYGACVAAGGAFRCGIDGAHCAIDETWLDPTEAAAQYDITCDCSDVRTGSCVDALTSTPRCTVDADSCDAGDTWANVAETEAGGTTCVLCDSADLVWPTAQPTTAAAAVAAEAGGASGTAFGACYDASVNVRRCEYNSSYCTAYEVWMAPTDLAARGVDACYCADTEIGACYDVMVTHVATCHVHANQCPDTYLWIASGYEYAGGQTCTCDENRNTGMTQYGACMDTTSLLPSVTCAYQKADCLAGETWLEPKDALALYGFECHCDDVLLGACAAAGLTTCAVDVDSCAAGATWLPARDVYDAGTHCRLCGLAPAPAPAKAKAEEEKDDVNVAVILLVVMLIVLVGIGGGAALMWFRHRSRPGDQSPRAVVPLAEARQLELATNVRPLPADAVKGVPVSGEAYMLPL